MLAIFTGVCVDSMSAMIKEIRDICEARFKTTVSCCVTLDSQDIKSILQVAQSSLVSWDGNRHIRLVVVHVKHTEHGKHMTHMRNIVESYDDNNMFAICYPGAKSTCDPAILSRSAFVHAFVTGKRTGERDRTPMGPSFRKACMSHASQTGDLSLQSVFKKFGFSDTNAACQVDMVLKMLDGSDVLDDKHKVALAMVVLEAWRSHDDHLHE